MKIMQDSGSKKWRIIKIILVLIALGLNIKYIFFDFGVDASFQISMSYRLATGDLLFKEMAEPYQLSAFLCAILIKVFLAIFKSTTGIAIYLQLCGVVIDGLVTMLLYKTVLRITNNSNLAFATGWILFVLSPKDVPIPEYTNMLVWFSTLQLIVMCKYFETRKNRYLILSGFAFCCIVLSYPSAVMVYVAVMIFLLAKKEYRAALIPTIICVVTGTIFMICVFAICCTPAELIASLNIMFTLEGSHSEPMLHRFGRYGIELLKIAALNLITWLIATSIGFAAVRLGKKEKQCIFMYAAPIYFSINVLLALYLVLNYRTYTRFNFYIFVFPVLVLGFRFRKNLSEKEQDLYRISTIVGLFDFISGLLLTNLNLIDTTPLLIICVIAAFIPIAKHLEESVDYPKYHNWCAIICLVAALLLAGRCIYVIRPLHGQIESIVDISKGCKITNVGPDKWIMSGYMGPYIQNISYPEWQKYINEGQSVYIMGEFLNSIGYLYSNIEYAAPSTVPTPSYNEAILDYWALNPEKYPDVVVASCWYGELDKVLSENEWLMNWIENEFCPSQIIDGQYWRYYIK